MFRTDVIIIGGGQAGLAMSRSLQELQIDHVVLERGQIGERWRNERWDSLRLLTPNWMTRLPGRQYDGSDPDGFMSRNAVIEMLQSYGKANDAPIVTGTHVLNLSRRSGKYVVETSRGLYVAPAVVLATGQCDRANIPASAAALPDRIRSIGSNAYKNPEGLTSGGVLIVGASATGLQLAEEIKASGRDVSICVGRHTRMPRRYRGRDITRWLNEMGALDQRWTDVPDIKASRRQPSLQLVGRQDNSDINLASLHAKGVKVLGRALEIDRAGISLASDLAQNVAHADRKLASLLNRIDAHIDRSGGLFPIAKRPEPLWLASPQRRIDFASSGIETVIWATGYKRDYSWLDVPVLDVSGEIKHDGGVTPAQGLYTLGLQFMRRRKSTFIDGVGDDAREIADHVHTYLGTSLLCAA